MSDEATAPLDVERERIRVRAERLHILALSRQTILDAQATCDRTAAILRAQRELWQHPREGDEASLARARLASLRAAGK